MISIIVPVYNTAGLLEQCLDSIRNQTLTELDVILVDDGSTDESGIICDRYAEKDQRFRVFHTENHGHYSARGFAIRKAREQGSEYVGFVDSDDWVEPEMYETMLRAAKAVNADIAECGYSVDYPDCSSKWVPEAGTFGRAEALRRLFCTDNAHDFFWNKLWKTSCFDRFVFPDARAYMDACITYRLYAGQNSFVNVPEAFCHYRQTTRSIVHSHDIRLINQWKANKDKYDYVDGQLKEILSPDQWTLIQRKQLAKCVYAIGRNWAWWNNHGREERKENRNCLKEMSGFLRTHTAFFGDPSWPASLRCTACLGRFPNRLSTAVARLMNRKAQQTNVRRLFEPAKGPTIQKNGN